MRPGGVVAYCAPYTPDSVHVSDIASTLLTADEGSFNSRLSKFSRRSTRSSHVSRFSVSKKRSGTAVGKDGLILRKKVLQRRKIVCLATQFSYTATDGEVYPSTPTDWLPGLNFVRERIAVSALPRLTPGFFIEALEERSVRYSRHIAC